MIQSTVFSTVIKSEPYPSLRLSPNDWSIPASNTIDCIYFYDIHQWSSYGKQSHDLFINPERLILSLKKLLQFYPCLDGIFTAFDPDKRICVEHDDVKGGVLFVSTIVNILMNEIPLSSRDYTNNKILPENLHLCNTVDNSETIFHARHTRFACGSVALGISLNHKLADAHSYFQVVNHWTELYKDLEYQPEISHQRSLLELSPEHIQTLKDNNADFNNRRSLIVKDELNISTAPLPSKELVVKVFRFSASELKRMKIDATTHRSSDINYISIFDALTAHLYRHVLLARQHSPSTISRLYIATNIRPRLTEPSLPSTYFGNAVMFSYLEMPVSEILQMNLASEIHRAVQENNNDDIRTTLAWIFSQRDPTKITPTFDLSGTDFTVSAWNKMGMYSNGHFENGIYPCRILLPPDMKFNGAAIFLSTEIQDESIDVALTLTVNEMERMTENLDFRKYRHE